jgi:hypothetical protein
MRGRSIATTETIHRYGRGPRCVAQVTRPARGQKAGRIGTLAPQGTVEVELPRVQRARLHSSRRRAENTRKGRSVSLRPPASASRSPEPPRKREQTQALECGFAASEGIIQLADALNQGAEITMATS